MADCSHTTTLRRGTTLDALSIPQLGALFDVYAQAGDLFLGLQNMPLGYGDLHHIAETRMGEFACRRYRLFEEAMRRRPTDKTEAAILAGIIAREADNPDEWAAARRAIAAAERFDRNRQPAQAA